jgi:hypothetical protein
MRTSYLSAIVFFSAFAAILPEAATPEVLIWQSDGTARTEHGVGPERSLYKKAVTSPLQVRSIAVEGDACHADISNELRGHGFLLADRSSADAVLDVAVRHDGEDGSYTANLQGVDGRSLFSSSGEEDEEDLADLCEDFGEEIADKLEDRIG